jgi:small-conductance mechanosensitive channel
MNFKKLLVSIAAIGTGLAVMGALIIPGLSFAQDYVVSPSYVGTSSLSVAQANQICTSLSDAVASQTSFCAYSYNASVPAPVFSIADNAILITVTSSSSATITWTTSVPTTTSLWLNNTPSYSNASVVSTNAADGYTMYHTITLTGLDLTAQHSFEVGGTAQGSSQMIMSAWQWL